MLREEIVLHQSQWPKLVCWKQNYFVDSFCNWNFLMVTVWGVRSSDLHDYMIRKKRKVNLKKEFVLIVLCLFNINQRSCLFVFLTKKVPLTRKKIQGLAELKFKEDIFVFCNQEPRNCFVSFFKAGSLASQNI